MAEIPGPQNINEGMLIKIIRINEEDRLLERRASYLNYVEQCSQHMLSSDPWRAKTQFEYMVSSPVTRERLNIKFYQNDKGEKIGFVVTPFVEMLMREYVCDKLINMHACEVERKDRIIATLQKQHNTDMERVGDLYKDLQDARNNLSLTAGNYDHCQLANDRYRHAINWFRNLPWWKRIIAAIFNKTFNTVIKETNSNG